VARCRLANIQSQWLILKPRARHAAMLLSSADQDQAPAITASRLSFVVRQICAVRAMPVAAPG
jgi:hypothetical protein